MLISVPQYIDVEDKIVGPLTAKQLGWVIALGVILLILWNTVASAMFFVIGIPVSLLFVALAFYRPYGQPLMNFAIFGVMFLFKPRIYVWRRTPQNAVKVSQKIEVKEKVAAEKHLTSQSLGDLARLLDSEGMVVENNIEKILKPEFKKK